MTTKKQRRYNLDAVHQQYADATGGDEVQIVLNEGTAEEQEFTFPHPVFASDDIKAAVNAATDDTTVAKALLGDQYEDFIQAGGRPLDVSLLFGSLFAESESVVKGVKVRPTRS